MSSLIDISKQWEGRLIDSKFPLQKLLAGSARSAVFLTERNADGFQKAAIKLIPAESCSAENLKEEDQLFRWADIAKLSHPNLIRLFESGRCQIDGTNLLYVVMEYAEEDLAQILPSRSLSPGEVREMLPPTVDALTFLHHAGFVHGHIKPSNVMAVNNQLKISADHLRKTGERENRESTAYDAPELASMGFSPAADLWSLGATLVAVLTQQEPVKGIERGDVSVSETVPEPFREIVRAVLGHPTATAQRSQRSLKQAQSTRTHTSETPEQPQSRNARIGGSSCRSSLLVAASSIWFGRKFVGQQPQLPAAETHPTESQPAPANPPAAQAPAPFPEKAEPTPAENTPGSVLQQVLPQVSRSAQNTIQGHVKVSVQLSVDTSGKVSEAKLVSSGPEQVLREPGSSRGTTLEVQAAPNRRASNHQRVDSPIPFRQNLNPGLSRRK